MPKAFEIYNCLNSLVNFLEKWESSPLSNLLTQKGDLEIEKKRAPNDNPEEP